jgi:hypothetical protein
MKQNISFFSPLPRDPVKADWKAAWRVYRKRGFLEARYYFGRDLALTASEVMIVRNSVETLIERFNARRRGYRKSFLVS